MDVIDPVRLLVCACRDLSVILFLWEFGEGGEEGADCQLLIEFGTAFFPLAD